MSNHWEVYLSGMDGHPMSVLVDIGISKDAPREELGELVTLRLRLQNPDEDGMMQEVEQPELDRIEDELQEGLADLDADVDYVGRLTIQGLRMFFYYNNDAAAVDASLRATMSNSPDYQYTTQTEDDPEWARYFEILYPDDRTYQVISNGHVLQQLEEGGDRLEIEREVVHWIYFPDADTRSGYEQAVKDLGYYVVDQQDDVESEKPFSLVVGKVTAVDYSTINDVVLELYDLAQEYDGEYTGWETAIQKE